MNLRIISDRIYYLPASQETDRPLLGYIKGDKYSLMVDAGNSDKHMELFYNELNKLGLPIPDYVVITHWHWDHTFGMCAVKGKVITNDVTNNQLIKMKEWEWTDEAMSRRLLTGEEIKACDKYIRLEYPNRSLINVKTADIVFNNSLSLDLGGINCRLDRIIAPHSEDSTAIYIPEERVLFIGDADCCDCYNNGLYDKSKLNALIKYLEALEFDTYLHGHDEPVTKAEALRNISDEMNKL